MSLNLPRTFASEIEKDHESIRHDRTDGERLNNDDD